MAAQRKNDSALILCQNNYTRQITLVDADESMAAFLGRSRDELKGSDLLALFAPVSREYFEDSIEFESQGVDISDAAQKLRELRIITASGTDIIQDFRLERLESPDGHGWFRLIFAGEEKRLVRDMLTQSLKTHFEGQASLSPDTGLAGAEAASAYLEMLRHVMPGRNMDACCAVLRIDRHDKSLARYGKAGVRHLLLHAANCCKSTFRSEDIVCELAPHMLALFLVDISQDSARVVLNRLRWNIRNHRIAFGGKEDFSVTVSIAFGSVLDPTATIMQRCQQSLHALGADERNQLIDLAHTS